MFLSDRRVSKAIVENPFLFRYEARYTIPRAGAIPQEGSRSLNFPIWIKTIFGDDIA